MLSRSFWFCAERSTSTRVRSNSPPARPFRHLLQPSFRRLHRAHRRVIAAAHEFAKGLPPLNPRLAQDFDALVHDRLIGPRRPEPEGHPRGKAFQLGRDGQQLVQRRLGRAVIVTQRRHQRRQLRVERVQPPGQFARAPSPSIDMAR
jgi:hypothetical protein